MTTIVYFNAYGECVSIEPTESNFRNVSIEIKDNKFILKDSLIQGYGIGTTVVHPFTDYACLNIYSLLQGQSIPYWLTVLADKGKDVLDSSKFDPGYFFIRYSRTTSFSAEAQEPGGKLRKVTFTLYEGYETSAKHDFISDTNKEPWTLTFIQTEYALDARIKYSNPLYKIWKDSTIIQEETEATGVVTIDTIVEASGTLYTNNKYSLWARTYDRVTSKHIDRNIFTPYDIITTNIINDNIWITTDYDIWVNPEDEYDDNVLLLLKFLPNQTKEFRTGVVTIICKSKNSVEESLDPYYVKYVINIVQKPYSDIVETSTTSFDISNIKVPYNGSTTPYSIPFTYTNINIDSASAISDSPWCTINNLYFNNPSNNKGLCDISWETNDMDYNRTAKITLTISSSLDDDVILSSSIYVIQYANNTGGDSPEISDGTITIIDDNVGEIYDSSSLLFKDNNANVFSTLESKDNTLFLGNYLNTNFSLQIFNKIGNLSNLTIGNYTNSVELATKGVASYSYIPNMSISSQDKKVFKHRENYSLGLVFIKETGVKSSVFYIGDYSPQTDPRISLVDNKYYLHKPVAGITLDSKLVESLKDINVIGIIPVYAYRNSHRVICQGFINPTVSSSNRKSNENLDTQYNWFQRTKIDNTTILIGENANSSVSGAEFQSRADNDVWTLNNSIITMNTPEIEASEEITNANLAGSKLKPLWRSANVTYTNSITLNVAGKYLHSKVMVPTNGFSTTMRDTRIALWYGYRDSGTINENSSEFINSTKSESSSAYKIFYIYPWQRNKAGGEGPESIISSKKYFTSMYIDSISNYDDELVEAPEIDITSASVYRDNYPSLLKFNDKLYQGNVDYIITSSKPYKAFASDGTYPKAHPDVGVYAGYNTEGNITDPISMKYKVAPHIAINIETPIKENNGVVCAELYTSKESYVFNSDPQTLSSLSWIKCGDIVSLNSYPVEVKFSEGDYFYGRFDTLRTYPYSDEDPNSVTDIVSGMLCSRVNLDARCDRNRGIGTALVTRENFNKFNPVYNQSNNYFTYQYYNLTNEVYQRKFSNSIQWSLTKNYGNEIDDWCNIQEINTLDLDGNKGQLNSLQRLGNNLIAFQDSGISQILYNESVQVSSTSGTPIEIVNSGKVNGKRYLYENVGCQDEQSIAITPNGIYFADAINKSLYRLGYNNALDDLCITGGMKSWGLSTIDNNCKCWYDLYSKEVIFTGKSYGLVYSDIFNRFQCFASYEGIDKTFSLNGRTYLFKKTSTDNNTYYSLWKKNAIDSSTFFSIPKNVEIEIMANPEPTIDKTFTNIEYRADGFKNNTYVPNATFNKLRAWNEYQDTQDIDLSYLVNKSSLLKKRFRMWHITIPRSAVETYELQKNNGIIQTTKIIKPTLDRIRNPWCKIKLSSNMKDMDKLIVHDIQVQYID